MHIQVSLTLEIDATATLSMMEHQIQTAGQQSMRDALRQTVRQWEKEHPMCPHCASQQVRLEGTVPRTVQALFGTVHLPRQRLRCQQCLHRFLPSGPLLHDLHQGRISPTFVEAAVVAGASWPYRQAAKMLARFCGAQISAEEIRLLTNRFGRHQAEQEEHAAHNRGPKTQTFLLKREARLLALPNRPPHRPLREIERSSVWMEDGCRAENNGEGWKGKWP